MATPLCSARPRSPRPRRSPLCSARSPAPALLAPARAARPSAPPARPRPRRSPPPAPPPPPPLAIWGLADWGRIGDLEIGEGLGKDWGWIEDWTQWTGGLEPRGSQAGRSGPTMATRKVIYRCTNMLREWAILHRQEEHDVMRDSCMKLKLWCGSYFSSSGGELTDSEAKRFKAIESSHRNDSFRTDAEANSRTASKVVDQNPPPPEPPKQDYIHVRARRGQATDSHSLAERARREKISERMKILQDLVPGCNKVIGKASVLDEIINYIQSLERQVEFLSMKLEAANAHVNNGIETLPSKDFSAQTYSTAPGLTFDPQTQREYAQGSTASDWLHMQIGGAYERVT